MKSLNCDLVHLGHSSFWFETKRSILVFDYFKDSSIKSDESAEGGLLYPEDFITDKDIFVFASHGHKDHFNPVILGWEDINPNIKYILSSDIKGEVDNEKYYYMDSYQTLNIKDISIKTYGSTDLGVSFLVDVDGVSLFHAGDLNWWHWKDRFTVEELKKEEEDFKREVENIRGENIDIALIPVDPRLEDFYHLAGLYFAEKVKPKYLVPMHFRDNFYVSKNFAKLLKDHPVKAIEFKYAGQRVTL